MRRKTKPEPESPEAGLEYEAEPDDRFEYDNEAEDFDEFDDREEDAGFYDRDLEIEEWPDDDSVGGEEEAASPNFEPSASIALRAEALWATMLAQARGVELPGAPDSGLKRAGTVAAIVLASVAIGAGFYVLGKGSGTDVEQARLEGQVAGREAGAIEGAAQGYATGFQKGRQKSFRNAYVPAYRLYYKRAFEQAGFDPPANKEIEVAVP